MVEIYEEKMIWKRWFGLFKMIRYCIEVEFKDELGERVGSYKGGVVGVLY